MTTHYPLITPLPFDSKLFGYPVGRCEVDETWDGELFEQVAAGYRLVYIFSKKPISIRSSEILPVDVKLTFEKEITSLNPDDLEIKAYSGEMTAQLIDLALESGVFSRFKTDPGFVRGEYEKLYRQWVENALEKREILLAEDFSGFVSCHRSDAESRIGLIAVDKAQRRRGLGKRLVRAAENFALVRGALTLRIGTQEANASAVSLYQSLGYGLIEKVHVYHWWANSPSPAVMPTLGGI